MADIILRSFIALNHSISKQRGLLTTHRPFSQRLSTLVLQAAYSKEGCQQEVINYQWITYDGSIWSSVRVLLL